jgi:ACS family hexuronate transporter-like MFS transporter
MIIVLVVVCLINTAWQLFRAWLHLFLQEGRGYTEQHTLLFNSAWFAATDVGCLGVGVAVLWLCSKGITVTRARQIMFSVCAMLCLTLLALPVLSKGWLLLMILLISGAGALGVFPLYHAFTQDISGKHQGKITGIAGVTAWFLVPPTQKLFGRLVDSTGSYDYGLAAAACLPAIAALILWAFWGADSDAKQQQSS